MTFADDILTHHGVKGMRWGVRKARDVSSTTQSPARVSGSGEKGPLLTDRQKDIAKKAAIGVGVLALVTGAAYGGYLLKESGAIKVSELRKVADLSKGAKAAEKIIHEPSDILHATRGKNVGFKFPRTGGLKNPVAEFEKAFGSDSFTDGLFKRYEGKIAASFNDLEGRKDAAGRLIPHQIIIPHHMIEGIGTIDDVKTKIYPILKDAADELYHRPKP